MAQILADVFVNRSVAYCFSLTAPPRTAVVRMFATVQGANRAGGWDEPELKVLLLELELLEELTDVDVATVSEAVGVVDDASAGGRPDVQPVATIARSRVISAPERRLS
jgi:hypothetical protein